MKRIRSSSRRIRLDRGAYKKLHHQILERDGWRCQNCGSREDLQVHHQQFRSRQGNDAESNLITLCAACHRHCHAC
jgi:5-methylcytosine-specific restriction endonuclease McrA